MSATFSWPAGKRAAVSLTWDDARESQLDYGLPILRRYACPATFYVLPAAVEARRADWLAAAREGHEIGNHTVHHPCSGNFSWQPANSMLEIFTLERLEAELLEANERLTRLFGAPPETYAYCCGQTFVGRGLAVKSYVPLIARHFLAGRLFRSEDSNLPERCDLAQLFGIQLDHLTFSEARAKVEAAIASGGWAIFAGHEVGDDPRALSTSPHVLAELCSYLQSRGDVWITTVRDGARHLASQRQDSAG